VTARRRAQYFVIGLGLLTLTAASALAQGNPNSLTPDEAKQGWKLLFDGKSLTGWEARTTSAPPATGDWSVQNGMLVCPGTTAGWIGSTQMFSDYKLSLEFRGSEKVNSGVFLRSEKGGRTAAHHRLRAADLGLPAAEVQHRQPGRHGVCVAYKSHRRRLESLRSHCRRRSFRRDPQWQDAAGRSRFEASFGGRDRVPMPGDEQDRVPQCQGSTDQTLIAG
jgi:hypothetical protein